MGKLENEWNKTPGNRYIHGTVQTGCDVENNGGYLHKTHVFLRKLESFSAGESKWINRATQIWDFEQDDWIIKNLIANDLDKGWITLKTYEGEAPGEDEQDFHDLLKRAKESYRQEQGIDNNLDLDTLS